MVLGVAVLYPVLKASTNDAMQPAAVVFLQLDCKRTTAAGCMLRRCCRSACDIVYRKSGSPSCVDLACLLKDLLDQGGWRSDNYVHVPFAHVSKRQCYVDGTSAVVIREFVTVVGALAAAIDEAGRSLS